MWKLISSVALSGLNAILGTAGKVLTDIHADNTTRQKNENDAGNTLASTITTSAATAGSQRSDIQKSQGTWGPFGQAGYVIAMTFAFHVVMITLDSTSWHLYPTMKFYFIPWLQWYPHVVGSWQIAALPPPFDATEQEILRALFYVGPPSAAIAIAAKAFRR